MYILYILAKLWKVMRLSLYKEKNTACRFGRRYFFLICFNCYSMARFAAGSGSLRNPVRRFSQ